MFQRSMQGKGPLQFAVWTYICAHAYPAFQDGKEIGLVEINPAVIAFLIGECTAEDVQGVINIFCQPDPKSNIQDEQGRKLIHQRGFEYRVVTFLEYRNRASNSPQAIANRKRVAACRAKKKMTVIPNGTPEDEPVHPAAKMRAKAEIVIGYIGELSKTKLPENERVRCLISERLAEVGGDVDGVKKALKRHWEQLKATNKLRDFEVKWMFSDSGFFDLYKNRDLPIEVGNQPTTSGKMTDEEMLRAALG